MLSTSKVPGRESQRFICLDPPSGCLDVKLFKGSSKPTSVKLNDGKEKGEKSGLKNVWKIVKCER